MLETADEPGTGAPGSEWGSQKRHEARYRIMLSLRLPTDGELMRHIVTAARERSVPVSVYLRSRIRQIVQADLTGRRDVRLGAVDSPDD